MKVHRFIGLSEIERLLSEGEVGPIGERDRMYFMPDDGLYSCSYEMKFMSCIVGELCMDNKSNVLCIHLDLPDDVLKETQCRYADPEGGYWDAMWVTEFHLFGKYKKDSITYVELYEDKGIFSYKLVRRFDTIEEAYEYLKEHSARSYE